MCSPYSTLKVSQGRPVGGDNGQKRYVSSSTEAWKQQDRKSDNHASAA